MATCAVLNLPEHGHMNATLPVVAELVRRGERVVYFATDPWRGAIEATGAQYVRYGDHDAFVPPPHTGGLYSVMAFLASIAEELLPSVLRRLHDERPDYLLVDSMCAWGQYAHAITGTPAVTLASVFVPNEALVTVPQMVREAYGAAPKETLLTAIEALDRYLTTTRRIDRAHGTLSPDIVGFFAGRQPLNIVFTSRQFHLRGEAYDTAYKFVGPSIDARSGTGPLPFTIRGDRPLIYISLGTIFNEQPRLYRACIDAFRDGAYEVVLSTGARVDRAALGPIPDHVTVRESVPQLAVLERASLFLTHGGMNSVNEALWFGVPLIVHPQHGDQHLVAARAVELGAGVQLGRDQVDPRRIRELAEQVLGDPSYREAAAQIRGSLRAGGGPRRAANAILRFARRAPR